MPLDAILKLKLAHAKARDAVYASLAVQQLHAGLQELFDDVVVISSRAATRPEYLQRPDYGRVLDDQSVDKLGKYEELPPAVSIVVADGLSAIAVNKHAIPVLQHLLPLLQKERHVFAPVCIASQARVAIGDHTGSLLKASLSLILIGERPGLTAPDSMSAYITYAPAIGKTDESRNCVSNIRPGGLGYVSAAQKIFYLVSEIFRHKKSGFTLKDWQHVPGSLSNGE